MNLDRNQGDGRGKYALIQIRKLENDDVLDLYDSSEEASQHVYLPRQAIHTGQGDPGDQFFVIKYKDRFASDALRAYGQACLEYAACADGLTDEERDSLKEFGDAILSEANKAAACGTSIPT